MGGGFGGRASIAGHTRRTTGVVKRVCVAVVCSALDGEIVVTVGTIWCVCVGRSQNLLKEERLAGASLIIFANKQDLAGALSMADIAKVLELDKIVKYVSASVVLPARFSLICVDGVRESQARYETLTLCGECVLNMVASFEACSRHWHIQACSAVTGDGLIDGMHWLVSDISSRIFMLD
jgi:ADP-ribosylation factor-like protein 2